MVFTDFLRTKTAQGNPMRRNFVPRNSGIRQVGSAHREGEGLAGNEGRGVGHGHLLPIGGDHADQLDVAGALRGQIRGIVEGLGGSLILSFFLPI